jgi:hypothetical protein
MMPVALHPRHWSEKFTTRIATALLLIAISFIAFAFFLQWRGRQLSGVTAKNVVERDRDGYYQRIPHIAHMKNRMSDEQAEYHFRYRRYQDWVGMTGVVFLVLTVLVVFMRGGIRDRKKLNPTT